MTRNGTSYGRMRWLAAVVAVAALAALAGCTDSGSDPSPVAPTDVGSTYQDDLRDLLKTVEYTRLSGELTREEFLDNVHEDDVDRVSALFYPDNGHPAAGQFIPAGEWEEPQNLAWDVYLTTLGNGGAIGWESQLLGLYLQHCGD